MYDRRSGAINAKSTSEIVFLNRLKRSLEVKENFCYVGDKVSSGGGCSENIAAKISTGL